MSDDQDLPHDPDPERARAFGVAISLMRMALALLDRVGEPLAAARLQHAIDTAERRRPGPPTAEDLKSFLDREHR